LAILQFAISNIMSCLLYHMLQFWRPVRHFQSSQQQQQHKCIGRPSTVLPLHKTRRRAGPDMTHWPAVTRRRRRSNGPTTLR